MKRPFIIGIGGSCSNSGKTTIACLLLDHFKKGGSRQQGRDDDICDADGPSSEDVRCRAGVPQRWGAIKYTKTELYTSLVDDRASLCRQDKDTGRFIDAGADEVVWVKAPYHELSGVLTVALERLSCLDGLIVEGNSAIEFLNPDIVIFIFGNKKKFWKTSVERLLGISDIIVYENESDLPEIAKTKRLFHGNMSGGKEIRGFFPFISELMHERKAERRNDEKGC